MDATRIFSGDSDACLVVHDFWDQTGTETENNEEPEVPVPKRMKSIEDESRNQILHAPLHGPKCIKVVFDEINIISSATPKCENDFRLIRGHTLIVLAHTDTNMLIYVVKC